jgi:hypothetical protein
MSYFWRKGLVGTTVAAAALLVTAPVAAASPPTAFTTSFQNTSMVLTGFRQADGNTFISQTLQVMVSGDLSGSAVQHLDVVFHPDGTFNLKGVSVCTCTLAGTGLSGTITELGVGTGVELDTGVSVSGQFTIGDGTGGLANMHGVGTFESSNGSSGMQSGVYHFDP